MNEWIAGKIEHWSIDKLVPYARNARTHSPAQIDQIAASIAEFGFTNPILVGSDGVIVAGHGRLEAARKLGLETVPVIVLDHLTPTQRRALVIADNRIAENAGWDEEMLSLELAELQELDFDLELTGFSSEEIDALLSSDFYEHENKYTTKIDAPHYQPTGECPPVSELCDLTKYNQLVAQINVHNNLAPDVKEFLLHAATRHIRFDFEKIAEFYAHADADVQRLMEESALVIIDFDKAIAGGYVKLSEAIAKIYTKEKEGR
jgi:hypothetical protein